MKLFDLMRVIKILTKTREIKLVKLLIQKRNKTFKRLTKNSTKFILIISNTLIYNKLFSSIIKSLKIHSI